MVEYTFLIAIGVMVVAALLAYKVVSGVLKIAIFVIAAVSIALGIGAFLVITDINDLKDNFGTEKNLVLLFDGTKVISGIEFHAENDPKIINEQQLDEYTKNLLENNQQAILQDYYKVIVMNPSLLDEEIAEQEYIKERALLFVPLLEKVFSDPLFLVTEYKAGNIEIYEETIVFKIIKLLPTSIVKPAFNKVISITGSVVSGIMSLESDGKVIKEQKLVVE